MKAPRAALFDLDDTLAEPHVRIADEMTRALGRLLSLYPVGIASAAPFARIERDVLKMFPPDTPLHNLFVFSENGAQGREWKGDWHLVYGETISDVQREEVKRAIRETMTQTDALKGVPEYGPRILDREAGITLSTLGIGAPQEVRRSWDPDFSRRMTLETSLQKKLSGWRVYIGGLTSIDISLPHVSKALAVEWLAHRLGTKPADMLYVGDALYPNGNDYVVVPTGIQTRATSGPPETLRIIEELLQLAGNEL